MVNLGFIEIPDTVASDAILSSSTPPLLQALGVWLLIVFAWLALLLITSIVLFVISCFKHNIPFLDIFSRSLTKATGLYGKIIKYYIPAIILLIVISVLGIPQFFFSVAGLETLSLLWYLVMVPPTLAFYVYYFIVDSSLAKSYYNSLQGMEFTFSWISLNQVVSLIILAILYIVIFIGSIALLGIPWILLGFVLPFVRYPVIVEDKDPFAAIREGFSVVQKEFWNVVFCVSMYALFVGCAELFLKINPLTMLFVNFLISFAVQPFATIWFTDIYSTVEGKYLADEAPGKRTSSPGTKKGDDPAADYVKEMGERGYTKKQIGDALHGAGYNEQDIARLVK